MSSKGSINKSGDMNPDRRLEVPDTPDRIRRTRVNLDQRSRNLRLSLNHRSSQPIIDLNSPTTPNDNQRKRKSLSPVISIPENSNTEFHRNKKGKNVVQEVGEESNRGGPAVRDNKGKGKLDVRASNDGVQEISPDQPCLNSPSRRVGQRWLVRNGMIAPSNTAKINVASNNTTRATGQRAPQPARCHSVGGAGENAVISEIVAEDLSEGVTRSRRELGATTSSSTSSWRSTHSNRPGPFNRTSTGSGRPNTAVSTTSIPVTTSTSTYTTGGIRAHPRAKGIIRSSVSLHEGESSSIFQGLETQLTNLTRPPRSRGRSSRAPQVAVEPVIDLDQVHSPDSGAARRARQLAHDEMIARQLQEQFYNEVPVPWSMEEMDASIAMSIQQEEAAMRATSIAPRASWAERSTRFVAASSLVRNNVAQQMHGHFNIDDYEALLALDDDNHLHTGASTSQINHLPESVVKSGNSEESCAVCLETPSVGEKIRHLPCLHKFHKDCIDKWLQRKKECPVCKCGIF